MNDPIDVARRYLRAIETGDEPALGVLIDASMVYRELPNRFMPSGSINDKQTMLARFAKGKTLTTSQRYEIHRAVVQGNEVALEVEWNGTLAVPLGSLAAGATMRVHSAIFLEVRDGKLVSQRNYDCFEPF